MTKIRTAEEVLTHYKGFINLSSLDSNLVIGIMKEYAKQFIEIAVDESFQRYDDAIDQYVVEYFDSTYEQREETINFEKSDTILKLKERVV